MSREALINLREYLLETLSYEDRMWLVSELEAPENENVSVCPYTEEELDKRFDEIEKEIVNEECTPSEDFFRELNDEFNLGWYTQTERKAV